MLSLTFVILIVSFAILLAQRKNEVFEPFVVNTVAHLDIQTYLGRWFIIYISSISKMALERDASCMVEDHILRPGPGDSVIAQFGVNLSYRTNDQPHAMEGLAFTRDFDSSPGKFILVLNSVVPTHWIVALGEVAAHLTKDAHAESPQRHQPHNNGSARHSKNTTHKTNQIKSTEGGSNCARTQPPIDMGIDPGPRTVSRPGNSTYSGGLAYKCGSEEGRNARRLRHTINHQSDSDSGGHSNSDGLPCETATVLSATSNTRMQHNSKQKQTLLAASEPSVEHYGDQYPWAIVSDASGASLFILARNVTQFRLEHEVSVLVRVRQLGFSHERTELVGVTHGNDCVYPEESVQG